MEKKHSDKRISGTEDHVEISAVDARQGRRFMNPRALQVMLITPFVILAVSALWLAS